jgi:hypothetical protein
MRMLSIVGRSRGRFCDGVSRRDVLRLGALAMGGLSMPQILEAEARAGVGSSTKSVIMVFLAGGPPHQDMFDLKMDAPAEIRGEYKPIATNLPGLDICEHMPRLATMMDKFVVIRSMVGAHPFHSAGQCLTGYTDTESRTAGGRPSLGSIVSHLQGPADPTVPAFVGLSPRTDEPRWGNPGEPGYLGMKHAPYTPFRSEVGNPDAATLDPERLRGRMTLLDSLDQWRREAEADEGVAGMDAFSRRARDILTSRKLFDALDVTREDPRLRARYGVGDMENEDDGPPCCNDHFLMARRLVEAGVRCVTISFGRWDTHKYNFESNRVRIPKLDVALSALIEDLHARGLDKDVSVVVWGEFGRTPTINAKAGRDHWPAVSFTLLAGGGMRTGQLIGATDKTGSYVTNRPVTFQSVFATLYHNLGINHEVAVRDRNNRPMYLLDKCEPIREII